MDTMDTTRNTPRKLEICRKKAAWQKSLSWLQSWGCMSMTNHVRFMIQIWEVECVSLVYDVCVSRRRGRRLSNGVRPDIPISRHSWYSWKTPSQQAKDTSAKHSSKAFFHPHSKLSYGLTNVSLEYSFVVSIWIAISVVFQHNMCSATQTHTENDNKLLNVERA